MRKAAGVLVVCAGLASACAQPAENKSAATPAPDSPTSTLAPEMDLTEAIPATTAAPTTTTTEPEPEPAPTTVFIAPPTTRRPAPTTIYVAPEPSSLDYGEWAIPRYIVSCETGGTFDWYAYNPSGASGPYQLMPLHFDGELAMHQSRAAQHAKAAELWDNGRGKRHWQACL